MSKLSKQDKALMRFLATRLRWTPRFAQEMQGWNIARIIRDECRAVRGRK